MNRCKLYNTDENITFIKLYSLLYADDTLILAENGTEPLHGPTVVYKNCVDNKLKVNPIKSKIVIFSTGKVKKYPIFEFGGSTIECPTEYSNFGFIFRYNNKFNYTFDRHISNAIFLQFLLILKNSLQNY